MNGDILTRIVADRKAAVQRARRNVPESELQKRYARRKDFRGLRAALELPRDGVRIIAEIKRASPSKGVMAADLDAADQARRYRDGGAAAISVLTEPTEFHGCLDDLERARAAVDLPVLRKDFLFDRYQVLEAAAHGADAVLLIVRMLGDDLLRDLLDYSGHLGLETLVEVHDREDAGRVSALDAPIVGINNRDLRTFGVDLGVAAAIRMELPPGRIVVAASGIRTRADVIQCREAGIRCFLVGECLVRSPDPAAHLRFLREGEMADGPDG